MTMGLGLAEYIATHKDGLKGTIKLIFQPAEEGVRGAKAMVEAGVVDDVDSVSYTHLDVYKRQQYGTLKKGFLGTALLWAIPYILLGLFGALLFPLLPRSEFSAMGMLLGAGVGSVSYTHLDVYKRQV